MRRGKMTKAMGPPLPSVTPDERPARCDVLVTAAFDPELTGFRRALGESFHGRIGNVEVVARSAGIGLVLATAGSCALIETWRPRAVVLVGTAGAYKRSDCGAPALNTAGVAHRVKLCDLGTATGASELLPAMSIEVLSDEGMRQGLRETGLPLVDVATTLGITVDEAAADALWRATDAHVEHMEAYGVAMACSARQVRFAAVLGVANGVGKRGRLEWRANHVRAAEAAATSVLRWLENGAPGLSRSHG
jgi:nucleoside phosphorylase